MCIFSNFYPISQVKILNKKYPLVALTTNTCFTLIKSRKKSCMGFDESPAPIHAGVVKSVPPFGFGQSIDISEDDPKNLDLVNGYEKVSGMKRKWVSLTFLVVLKIVFWNFVETLHLQ